MFKSIKKKVKSDEGASTTIEFIWISLVLFMAFLIIMDFGMYFINTNIVTASAQNGARLAAVYGGTAESNSIYEEYGNKNYEIGGGGSVLNNSSSPVEQAVAEELNNANGISLEINGIECGPDQVQKVGTRTYCTVNWSYKNLTPLTMIGTKTKDTNPNNIWGQKVTEKKGYVTQASAESEVLFER